MKTLVSFPDYLLYFKGGLGGGAVFWIWAQLFLNLVTHGWFIRCFSSPASVIACCWEGGRWITATPAAKQFRPSPGGTERLFFFFFNASAKKASYFPGWPERAVLQVSAPGCGRFGSRESQRGRSRLTSSGFPVGRPGWPGRGWRAELGPVGPSGRAALPAALKAPTMQRWRPSSVTPSLRAPAKRRGAGGRGAGGGGGGCNPSARPRGAPPRRSARALSLPPGEGAEPPGGPARPPAQRHRPRELAGRQLGRPRSPGAPHRAPRPAEPRPPARPPAAAAAAQGAAPARGAAAARALAAPAPRPGGHPHLAPASRCAARARPGAGASGRCGARGPWSAAEGGARPRAGAARPPASPVPRLAPPGGLRGRRSCETEWVLTLLGGRGFWAASGTPPCFSCSLGAPPPRPSFPSLHRGFLRPPGPPARSRRLPSTFPGRVPLCAFSPPHTHAPRTEKYELLPCFLPVSLAGEFRGHFCWAGKCMSGFFNIFLSKWKSDARLAGWWFGERLFSPLKEMIGL